MAEKYPVGIAGPDLNRIGAEYTNLISTHERFVLASLAASWRAFQEIAQESEPMLLIVFAEIAPSPDALKDVLAKLKKAVVILLLPSHWAQFQGVFEQLGQVRKIFIQPAAPKEVLAYGLTAIETEIARNRSTSPLQSTSGGATSAAVGTRVIAFVSAQGGVGRSTLAEAMGFELVARRNIRTLLLSFDLPTCAPLRLGTRFAPTAAEYLQRTEGGFRDAVQSTADGLDVIIAPDQSTAYAAAMRDGEQAKIHDLVNHASHQLYAAILLDLPTNESAWMVQPLRVANTVVIVSRPTTEGIRACGHVMELLTEVVGAQHRFTRDAFFLVLNHRTPKTVYTAPAFATELAKHAHWSPPVLAVVDEDPEITRAQDGGRPAVSASESLGRAAATLVETFYGQARGTDSLRRGFKIGRIKIRPTEEH
jgi:MinD-like ATPase involved in chromosome partitioning or flagellar assembly